MKHSVRRTLVSLGSGIVLQRVLQLVAFVLIGRTLGVSGLGSYAQGMSVAAVLVVLSGAGVRNLVARAISREPDATRQLVVHAVHLRLLAGTTLATLAVAVAFVIDQRPWFWLLCALHVVPAAFDLKGLVDVAGRARREVVLDSLAALLQLTLVACWAVAGDAAAKAPMALELLAGISLGCRSLYAAGAAITIRNLPGNREPGPMPRGLGSVALGTGAHELMTIGDVALVALCLGPLVAGYYAVAMRFATAAMLPSMQLARLLLPHLLHAGRDGDRQRTFVTALRATLWLAAPVCFGGVAVAGPIAGLNGAAFVAAGGALQLLLFAGLCQHTGWQCSLTLLAAGRDKAYAHSIGWPSAVQALLLLGLGATASTFADGSTAADAALLATLAAAITALCQAGYLTSGLLILRAGDSLLRALPGPATAGLATAAAALLAPIAPLPPGLGLPLQLASGAAAFGLCLWWLELRGRLGRIGDGLATASGFDN